MQKDSLASKRLSSAFASGESTFLPKHRRELELELWVNEMLRLSTSGALQLELAASAARTSC
jgi:hypothetical protein